MIPIDSYRIGWRSPRRYRKRRLEVRLPWQAEVRGCTCDAARGLTERHAERRVLRLHERHLAPVPADERTPQ